ncbi:unnamed protein product [Arctia plantaginis]|uniref:Uncharacterized protein n=1 Tax=Arctia plantaginis TaxID=874455 RepID=A0A8S1AQL2_ARCPL|nr:unnamed protein product [Arctia plantaginis]CAB3248845.1 unnamed protein product [Arctia plantaginis]
MRRASRTMRRRTWLPRDRATGEARPPTRTVFGQYNVIEITAVLTINPISNKHYYLNKKVVSMRCTIPTESNLKSYWKMYRNPMEIRSLLTSPTNGRHKALPAYYAINLK